MDLLTWQNILIITVILFFNIKRMKKRIEIFAKYFEFSFMQPSINQIT